MDAIFFNLVISRMIYLGKGISPPCLKGSSTHIYLLSFNTLELKPDIVFI